MPNGTEIAQLADGVLVDVGEHPLDGTRVLEIVGRSGHPRWVRVTARAPAEDRPAGGRWIREEFVGELEAAGLLRPTGKAGTRRNHGRVVEVEFLGAAALRPGKP